MCLPELLALPDRFEWLVRGWWPAGSYGQLAGEKKTLKSHVATLMALAVASGRPFLGDYDVPRPGPVLFYVGEGGITPWRRRLVRLAAGMGIYDLASLPIYPVFDKGQILSPAFQEGLRRNLGELTPALAVLDPYYTYHGPEMKASNLHEEGHLLNALSAPCDRAGSALVIVNHYNKTGGGRGFGRITQVGAQEHSDSWITLDHRRDPDVERGLFQLQVEIGGRQWGGKTLDIDFDLAALMRTLVNISGTHRGLCTGRESRASARRAAMPSLDSKS
jgi:RecA-family ATPase